MRNVGVVKTPTDRHIHERERRASERDLAGDDASFKLMFASENDGLLFIQPLDLVSQLWDICAYA